MLLSCGANPHQTNMKRKKPLDLINSNEMSDIFNLHGIQHANFEKKDTETRKQDAVTSSDSEKVLNGIQCNLHFFLFRS